MKNDNNKYHWYLITYTYFYGLDNEIIKAQGIGEIFMFKKLNRLTNLDLGKARVLASENIKVTRQIKISNENIMIMNVSYLGNMTKDEFDGKEV